MIKSIHLKNFKSHADTSLELSNINILTGMNGLGKSSVIQALLLLRQSHSKGLLTRGLDLNGELCSIGSISDCIYQFATSDNIDFEIQIDNKAYKWSFTSEITNLSDTFIKVSGKSSPPIESDNVIFNNNFQYISAFRNGPINDYDKDTSSVELLNQISRREGRCELVAHFLYFFKSNIVSDALVASPETDPSLTMQVEAWMGEISPNINIHVQPNDTSFKINYSYNRGTGKVKTNEFKASNIGFGVSYALPIVVATLQACSKSKRTPEENLDKFIVIENPEAHIHPSGQAKLMNLICLAAQNGVQFLIETHSDHIVNGLLVATKRKVISPEQSRIYYFDREDESHATKSHLLGVLPDGKIKNAPKGFFDQIDKDMSTLMGF